MESLFSLYKDHLAILQQRTQEVLQRHRLNGLLIHSGEPINRFLDNHDYPFKVNPQFKAWLPVTRVPHCWLWVDGVNKPTLWYYLPLDYWHLVEPVPDSFWTPHVNIVPFAEPDEITTLLPPLGTCAYLGSALQRASRLGIENEYINPQPVLDYLHFHRAYKTDYELACMREAQKSAVNGHRAAKEAFLSDMSEFDINIAYLSACGHRDTDVPYDNIVALNEHAAVLQYTHLDHQTPDHVQSFLIDAGTEYNGYSAKLSRTYAVQKDSDFSALITAMNQEQLALTSTIETGINYIDYHVQMHGRIAKLLRQFEIIRDLSEDAMVDEGITVSFLPHGLGHQLGLQVYDVAGFMQDDRGTSSPPPPLRYPHLLCTRLVQPRMVLTIKPGLYFIETLLAPWRTTPFSRYFNWSRIERFKPYGGIRIEDNIIIHANHIENMTRVLKLS